MKFPNNIQKKSFTLLEVLLTIFLAGTIFIFFGIKAKNILDDHKFKVNIDRVNQMISSCKARAILAKRDLFLIVEKREEGISFNILNSNLIEGADTIIKGIDFIFNDENVKKLSICYASTGNNFPHGKIIFFDKHSHLLAKEI
jgi:hypothetical protein